MVQEISGPTSLHRLIYYSRQAFAPAMRPDDEVAKIVEVSVARNGADDITGLLLDHEGWFVQALEGRAERVMTTYQRILNDHRHKGSKIISAGPAQDRDFGAWNMCARRLSATDGAILKALSQRQEFDPTRLTATTALRLLQAVRNIKDRTAAAA